jgi:hypothetical protein
MRTIEAGTSVRSGHYFCARSWSLHPVARDGELLPGRPGERWVRVPLLLALALAPLLGAAFAVFLPLIGFLLAAHAAIRPVARLFAGLAKRLAATVEPGWEPGFAHLTGKRGSEERAEQGSTGEDPLDELEREIAALRAMRRPLASHAH